MASTVTATRPKDPSLSSSRHSSSPRTSNPVSSRSPPGVSIAADLPERTDGPLGLPPELVELVGVSLVDGDLGDLPVVDLEVERRDHVQGPAVPRGRLPLQHHCPLRFTEHVQDLDLEGAVAACLQLPQEAEHGIWALVVTGQV